MIVTLRITVVCSGVATAVLPNNAAIVSGVGYLIPGGSYHFVIAVWREKEAD
jgi:hypothetical protein